ncbi:MAG TPA: hypothetical protein VGR53_08935 [Nitrososphaerales archaeon]|nr:hypothetical protein [Nitrososphaerales archaeon]
MKRKFFLNYRVAPSRRGAKDESTSGNSGDAGSSQAPTTKHHYLHDHRTRDALQEYRESLPE